MASITVKAEIVHDGGGWMVRTYLQDEVLALHGPVPTEELANALALEQIEIARKSLAETKAKCRQYTVTRN